MDINLPKSSQNQSYRVLVQRNQNHLLENNPRKMRYDTMPELIGGKYYSDIEYRDKCGGI